MIINGITWSDEDIKLVEKFIEIKQKGYYCDGKQLTEAYNRLLGKQVHVTQCGSCLRGRVNELEIALNHAKAKEAEQAKLSDVIEITSGEESKPKTKKSKK